jgi:hypothetical protein
MGTNFDWGNTEGKRPLGRPRQNWRTLLEWILGKQVGKMWSGFIWFRIRTGSCEHGNEPSAFIKGGEFLD